MAIYDMLPKFHVVEPNNLKGLQPGFVVAQAPIKGEALTDEHKSKLISHKHYVENGHLAMAVITSGQLEMDVWASAKIVEQGNVQTNPVMYIAYSEPLNTVFNSDKFYATDINEECVRFVQLIPGDEWTTDIDYNKDPIYSTVKTELLKHVKEITKGDDFLENKTLADGTEAHHYVYLG